MIDPQVQEETLVVVVLIEIAKCIMQFVVTVVKTVRFPLSQLVANLSIAVSVLNNQGAIQEDPQIEAPEEILITEVALSLKKMNNLTQPTVN